MRRLISLILILSTIFLGFLVARKAIKHPKINEPHFETTKQMIFTYADIKTRILNDTEYVQIIKKTSATNLNQLDDEQRDKLYEKLHQFYVCYTSGDFTAYKQFRLDSDYIPSDRIINMAKKIASENGISVTNNQDFLRLVWEHHYGLHKITTFDPTDIKLTVFYQQNITLHSVLWRKPSNLMGYIQPASRCWEGAIKYVQDSTTKGNVLMAAVDQFVRFDGLTNAPASPLRLALYWDTDQHKWMPLALCTTIKVGNYTTMF